MAQGDLNFGEQSMVAYTGYVVIVQWWFHLHAFISVCIIHQKGLKLESNFIYRMIESLLRHYDIRFKKSNVTGI